MDARRVNDILKIVGALAAGGAILAPVLSTHFASVADLIAALLKAAGPAVAAFAAGMGTRGFGVEYQDVADAKASAKTIPPGGA